MGQFALALATLLLAAAGTAHAQGSPSSQLPSTSIFTSVGAAAVVAVLAVGLVAAYVARTRTSKSVNAGDMHLHSIHITTNSSSNSNNNNTHEIQFETGFGDVENVYDFYTQNDLSSLHTNPDNAPQLVTIQPSDTAASDLEEIVSLSFGSSSRTSILSISSSILYPEENCGGYSDSDETTVEDIVSVYSYELDEDSLDGIGTERYLQ
ncbi:hypothetical protein HDU80_005772 [Chytriomyces hyalinus]|nr:hypothetical protein HDU80_005772 [Chytriomyces hyalinus]